MKLKTVIMRLKNVDFMGYIFTFYPAIMIYYSYFFFPPSFHRSVTEIIKYTDSLSTELLLKMTHPSLGR